jgi:hypothetical protein
MRRQLHLVERSLINKLKSLLKGPDSSRRPVLIAFFTGFVLFRADGGWPDAPPPVNGGRAPDVNRAASAGAQWALCILGEAHMRNTSTESWRWRRALANVAQGARPRYLFKGTPSKLRSRPRADSAVEGSQGCLRELEAATLPAAGARATATRDMTLPGSKSRTSISRGEERFRRHAPTQDVRYSPGAGAALGRAGAFCAMPSRAAELSRHFRARRTSSDMNLPGGGAARPPCTTTDSLAHDDRRMLEEWFRAIGSGRHRRNAAK